MSLDWRFYQRDSGLLTSGPHPQRSSGAVDVCERPPGTDVACSATNLQKRTTA